jgi:hypothetical protein
MGEPHEILEKKSDISHGATHIVVPMGREAQRQRM